jgi:hypothetical protein
MSVPLFAGGGARVIALHIYLRCRDPLDATLIRLLLVPAMMCVLGAVNWWPAQRPSDARGGDREVPAYAS